MYNISGKVVIPGVSPTVLCTIDKISGRNPPALFDPVYTLQTVTACDICARARNAQLFKSVGFTLSRTLYTPSKIDIFTHVFMWELHL